MSIIEDAILVLLVTLAVLLVVLWLWTTNRVYEDAERRGWPAFWIALAAFCTWPLGWILYGLQRRQDERKKQGGAP